MENEEQANIPQNEESSVDQVQETPAPIEDKGEASEESTPESGENPATEAENSSDDSNEGEDKSEVGDSAEPEAVSEGEEPKSE